MSDYPYLIEEFLSSGDSEFSMTANDDVMQMTTLEDALEMARWMLEGGPETLEQGDLPVLNIFRWEADEDGEEQINEAWVQYSDGVVTTHMGDCYPLVGLWAQFGITVTQL